VQRLPEFLETLEVDDKTAGGRTNSEIVFMRLEYICDRLP